MLVVGSGMSRRPLAPAAATSPRQPATFMSVSGQGALVLTMIPASLGPPLCASKMAYSPCQLSSGPSLASTIGLRSSTGRSPCGALEPRLRLSVQLIATTASASVRVLFSLQNRATSAVGGMIARLPTGFFRFVTAAVFAAGACQSGGGTGGTGGTTAGGGTSGGAGVSGAAGATGGTGNGGAAGASGAAGTTGASGSSGGAGASGGSAGVGAAGTTGAGGSMGAAGTGGSTGNGGRGGSGTGGTGGGAGTSTGGRGGSSGGTGGQAGSGGSGGVACTTPPPTGPSFTIDATGVTVTLNPGRMRLQVCQADIIRVQYTGASAIPSKTSLSVS